jgi:hypothetical protein
MLDKYHLNYVHTGVMVWILFYVIFVAVLLSSLWRRKNIGIALSFCYTYVRELKMAAPSEEKLICDINLIWKHLLSTKWKFQSFGRRERCFHWNQNGKWQIIVIWEHSGAIFVYISSITCAPCKTSSEQEYTFYSISKYLKMYKL